LFFHTRTDWAYDRYYEGKASLGLLYSGMRNLNVLFVNFLRENRVGESEEFTKNTESSNVDGTFDPNAKERNAGKVTARTSFSSAAGTYDEFDSQKTYDERLHINKQVRKDRAELLRLTNVMYALMRQALRELRVARNLDVSKKFNFFGKADPKTSVPSSDADCLLVDDSGSPKLPNFLRPGEAQRLAQLSQSNRHNWIAMRIQNLVETNRRLGNIGERASFEIYQEIEACLAAYKAMERIVSTPIPFTYTHMLQLILFFFVFSAPFVFTTTFHWIAFVPSVIVAIGFYGVNEMGKVIQVSISHLPHSCRLIAHTRLTLSCLSLRTRLIGDNPVTTFPGWDAGRLKRTWRCTNTRRSGISICGGTSCAKRDAPSRGARARNGEETRAAAATRKRAITRKWTLAYLATTTPTTTP